jgi:hypothetical protein
MQIELAVGRWYQSNPAIRRLWAIRRVDHLRVIVSIEPTLDNDDVYPVWLVNRMAWAAELQARAGCEVRMELLQEFPWNKIGADLGGDVVIELNWRDATL